MTLFTENIRYAPDDELVCYCSGVTKRRILSAFRAGATSLADIKAVTGACTVGRCKELNPRGR
ncbi:MAG: (2Fe-2S)-binding protein [Proteobacteria bacterium]|nr:(2Fe-2S)-binding protein [Pseudomonadota bacterium]